MTAQMTPLRRRVIDDMTIRNMSSSTQNWGQSGKHVLGLRFTAFGPSSDICVCIGVHAFLALSRN